MPSLGQQALLENNRCAVKRLMLRIQTPEGHRVITIEASRNIGSFVLRVEQLISLREPKVVNLIERKTPNDNVSRSHGRESVKVVFRSLLPFLMQNAPRH